VSDDPAQVGLVPDVTAVVTEGVTPGVMDIVMPVLTALVWLEHVDAGGIDRLQITTSPFANVVEVNVVLFVPTFAPFTFHW
jgi:hypothetical protein